MQFAVPHPALRNQTISEMLDVNNCAIEHNDLKAIFVVNVDMQRCD